MNKLRETTMRVFLAIPEVPSMTRFHRYSAILMVVSCFVSLPSIAQDRETEGTGPRQRQEWFYRQRAYPNKRTPPGARLRASTQMQLMQRREAAAGLPATTSSWALIGPRPTLYPSDFGINFSPSAGRITAIAADNTDTTGNTVYLGTAEGVVWKTTTGGSNWTALTTTQFSLATGAEDPYSDKNNGYRCLNPILLSYSIH